MRMILGVLLCVGSLLFLCGLCDVSPAWGKEVKNVKNARDFGKECQKNGAENVSSNNGERMCSSKGGDKWMACKQERTAEGLRLSDCQASSSWERTIETPGPGRPAPGQTTVPPKAPR